MTGILGCGKPEPQPGGASGHRIKARRRDFIIAAQDSRWILTIPPPDAGAPLTPGAVVVPSLGLHPYDVENPRLQCSGREEESGIPVVHIILSELVKERRHQCTSSHSGCHPEPTPPCLRAASPGIWLFLQFRPLPSLKL